MDNWLVETSSVTIYAWIRDEKGRDRLDKTYRFPDRVKANEFINTKLYDRGYSKVTVKSQVELINKDLKGVK